MPPTVASATETIEVPKKSTVGGPDSVFSSREVNAQRATRLWATVHPKEGASDIHIRPTGRTKTAGTRAAVAPAQQLNVGVTPVRAGFDLRGLVRAGLELANAGAKNVSLTVEMEAVR